MADFRKVISEEKAKMAGKAADAAAKKIEEENALNSFNEAAPIWLRTHVGGVLNSLSDQLGDAINIRLNEPTQSSEGAWIITFTLSPRPKPNSSFSARPWSIQANRNGEVYLSHGANKPLLGRIDGSMNEALTEEISKTLTFLTRQGYFD